MTLADEAKEKIISEFAKELDKHLFSDKSLPRKVTVTTEYAECTQSITIYFKNDKEN